MITSLRSRPISLQLTFLRIYITSKSYKINILFNSYGIFINVSISQKRSNSPHERRT